MKRTKLLSIILILITALPVSAQQAYDIVIANARILDGTGNPWYYADVGISGDRIVAVGNLDGARAARTIDADGLYLTPGFIDVHSHSAGGLSSQELSHGQPLLAQGITTVVANPDGGGPTDLRSQQEALLEDGLGVNVAQLVPHGSIRGEVIGMEDREPTAPELDRMKGLVRRGMEQGAFGLSSGLYYAPGSYSRTEEVIELARVAGEFGGIYTSHIRDEADYNIGVVGAVDEVIRVSREGGLPGVVTHIKALGPRVWGYSQALIRRIEQARAEGLEVYADQYPYEASGTSVTGALIPRWAQVGGREELLRRLNDETERVRVRSDVIENLDRRGGAGLLQFRRYAPDPSIEGKTLEGVANERTMHPADLATELLKEGNAGLVSFNMDSDDVQALMRQPWTMTSSDGGLGPMGEGVPHPRNYGTFPRKIRKYALEEGVVSLEGAVRSMTSLPASVFRMKDRGQIREGAIADVVVFDPATIRDRAEYQQPHQLSEGMRYVFVNGVLAVDDGEFTGTLNGRMLSRSQR